MSAVYFSRPRVEITIQSGEQIAQAWKTYRPYVVAALEFDLEEIDDLKVLQGVRNNHYLALSIAVDDVIHGIAICEQRKATKGWDLDVLLLAGDAREVWEARFFEVVKMVARSQNCSAVRTRGRLGWQRVLKGYGFKPVSVTMRLELDNHGRS